MTLAEAQTQTNGKLSKASIEVGSATLRLGMTKAQVKEKLAQSEITKLGEDAWKVGPLGKDGPVLQFQHGLLSYAEREWKNSRQDPAEALFGAVRAINNEGFSTCTVNASTELDSMGWRYDRVSLLSG